MAENSKILRRSILIDIGLSLVILLIMATLSIAIYETVTSSSPGFSQVFKDPRVVTVAIGLIISVLFVERWHSLEGRLDKLLLDQREAITHIRTAAGSEIDAKIAPLLSRAESISANILGIEQRHPWLEVISERDIVVETDGLRGILRTCEWLLQDGQLLQLYEYLEYCSKKGTSLDSRKKQSSLRGTADDFVEVASFCETWLGEYHLASEFIARYVEASGPTSYILLPHYIAKLTRNGNLPEVDQVAKRLLKIVMGGGLLSRIRIFLGVKKPISESFRWRAFNALALAMSATGSDSEMKKFSERAKANAFAKVFDKEQMLFDAELAVIAGEFERAGSKLDELETLRLSLHQMSDVSYLYAKIGQHEKAIAVWDDVMARRPSHGDEREVRNVVQQQRERGGKEGGAGGEDSNGRVMAKSVDDTSLHGREEQSGPRSASKQEDAIPREPDSAGKDLRADSLMTSAEEDTRSI